MCSSNRCFGTCSDTEGVTVFTRLLVQNRCEQQNHILLKNNIDVVFKNHIVCFACISFFLTQQRLSQQINEHSSYMSI